MAVQTTSALKFLFGNDAKLQGQSPELGLSGGQLIVAHDSKKLYVDLPTGTNNAIERHCLSNNFIFSTTKPSASTPGFNGQFYVVATTTTASGSSKTTYSLYCYNNGWELIADQDQIEVLASSIVNNSTKIDNVLGTADDAADKNTVYGAKAAAAAASAAASTADGKAVNAAKAAATAQGEVDALETVVGNLKTSLETADSNLDKRIDDIETLVSAISGSPMDFIGVSTTDPSKGTVTIEGKVVTPTKGDVVIFKVTEGTGTNTVTHTIEYVYDGTTWVELGDVSDEAKRISALETDVGKATIPAQGKEGEEGYKPEVSATGLHARIENLEDTTTSQGTAITNLTSQLTWYSF